MAIEDAMGRSVDAGSKTMAEIKAMLSSLMQGKVGSPTKVGDGKSPNDEKIKEVIGLIGKLNTDIVKELQETRQYLSSVVNMANAKTSSKEKPGFSEGATEAVTSTEKYIKEMHKHATTAGSLYVADIVTHKLLNTILTQGFKVGGLDISAELEAVKKTAGEATAAPAEKVSNKSADVKKLLAQVERAGMNPEALDMLQQSVYDMDYSLDYGLKKFGNRTKSLMADMSTGIQRSLFGLDEKGSLGQQVFGGMVDEEIKFIKSSRAAAYEVAGITSETKGLQKEFTKLEQSAYLTGFGRSEMQKAYLDNMKKGVKDQKVARALSVSQLQVAKQFGLEADAFSENFRNLNLAGGMSVNQIDDMANGMKMTARNAGIAGEQLKKAVDSAEEITKLMINAGTLTSAAAKNVTSILASAQKFGVGDQASELLRSASSSATLMLSASDETKNLLYNAAASVGRIADLQKGVLLRSKSGIKDLRKGFDSILRNFGVESAEAIDNLSDESKMQLNIQLKSTFGMELGEFKNTIQALQEQEQGLADKMGEINKKRKKAVGNEEKLAQLAQDERKYKIESSLGALVALEEASKGAKDMNQALAKFGQRKSEFQDDIKALGGDFKDSASAAKTALTSAITNVNEGLKKAGKSQLNISSDEIVAALKDPAAYKELVAQINDGNKELETAQKAQLDPMSAVEQSAKELNDQFRGYSGPALQSLTDLVGYSGMMAAALGTMGTSAFFEAGEMYGKLGPAFSSIKSFFQESMKQSGASGVEGAGAIVNALKDTAGAIFEATFDIREVEEARQSAVKAAKSLWSGRIPAAEEKAGASAEVEKKIILDEKEPPKPKAMGGGDVQAALELILEEMHVVRGTIKDNMIRVKIDEDFYDFWKKETKKIVKAIIWASKNETTQAKKTSAEALSEVKPTSEKTTAEALSEVKPPSEDMGGDVKAPQSGLLDFLKDGTLLEKAGDALVEYGPLLAILAAGLVAVATAIMAIMNQVFKYTGLDMGSAVQTAVTIGVILGGFAALAAATVAGYKALADFEQELNELDWQKGAIVGAKLGILAVGLSALAIATIFAIKTLASIAGVDLSTIADLGVTMAGVIGAIVAIGGAVKEAIPALVEYAPVLDEARSKYKDIIKGGLALLILAPALTLLGLAILKTIDFMGWMFGIDFGKAVEIGYNVAAILGVTAAIAFAVMGSMAGLYGLGLLAGGATWAIAGIMALGAVALLVLAPATAALGMAVLAMISEVGDAFSIDAAKAYEIGDLVAAVLYSAGKIALMTIFALAGLNILGSFAIATAGFLPLAFVGAAALRLFAPAVTELAMSVLALIADMGEGYDISADKAYEIAELVGAVLWATGEIAAQTLMAMTGLFALGAFVSAAYQTLPLILLGGAALRLFAPAVFDLGAIILASIIGMAEEKGLDLEAIEYAGQLFSSVLYAVSEICIKMLAALGGLYILGELAALLWWTIPIIILGVAAFSAGMGTFGLLAIEIAYFGYFLNGLGLDITALEQINTAIGMIQSIFTNIGATLMTFSNEILPLFDGFLWFNSVADNIRDAIPSIEESFFSIVSFIYRGILRPILLLPAPAVLQYAQQILEPLPSIFKSVASVINSVANELVPLFDGFLWFNSVADNINKALPQMRETIPAIFRFVDEAIIDPVFKNIGNPRDVMIAAQALEGVAKVLTVLPDVITGVSDNLKPLLKKNMFTGISKLDKAEELIAEVGNRLGGVFKFIDQGIITPIFDNIGNPRDVKIAAEALEGVSKMLPLIPEAVTGISKHIGPLMKKGYWSGTTKLDNAEKIALEVGEKFADVCKFVDKAIIDPVFKNIGNPRDVKIAAEALEGVAKMLPLLPEAVNGISKHIKPLIKKGGIFGGKTSKLENVQAIIDEVGPQFADIFKFLDQGIITPIFENIGNPRDLKVAAEALVATNELLAILPREMNALAVNLVPLKTAFMSIANIDLPDTEQVVKFMGSLGANTQMIGSMPQILLDINDGMRKIIEINQDYNPDEAAQKASNILGGLNTFIVNGLNPNLTQNMVSVVGKAAADMILIGGFFKTIADSLLSIQGSMTAIGTTGGKLASMDLNGIANNLVAGGKIAGMDINGMANNLAATSNLPAMNIGGVGNNLTPPGSVPGMAPNVTAGANTPNPVVASTAATAPTAANIQQKLNLQTATTAPNPTNVASTDLSQLNETSADQLSVNEQMKNILQQILGALAQAPAGNPPAGITPSNITTKAGNTFRLATGRYGESSAVGVTNL